MPAMIICGASRRTFALPKYTFEDERYEADRFQQSMKTHKSNAEELINAIPVVEVDGDTARCTGVNELGLGHPVQYIQLNRRYENTPTTCKWCGLRFRKREAAHDHHYWLNNTISLTSWVVEKWEWMKIIEFKMLLYYNLSLSFYWNI